MSNEMKTGSVLYSSWGYEQTNITFYRITKLTAKTVWFRKIKSKQIESSELSLTGIQKPVVRNGDFVSEGETFRRKRGETYIRVTDYQYAKIWDGNPCSYTAYA